MTFVHRPILMSDAGAVVSGHHKASEAGAAVLRAGGNAIDAAVAASAVLCVAIPHMNGLGGDCIALHFDAATKQTTAINGSGRAPAAATPQRLRAAGCVEMPTRGPLTAPVCGLVDAWEHCLERFGTRALAELLQPAVRLAREGVPIDLNLRAFLSGPIYAALARDFPALVDLYGPPGLRPLGARLRNPALENTLRSIAAQGAETLYRGALGRALVADLAAAGTLLSGTDFADHATRFDAPLTVPYLGRRLHAAPPNAQGIALAVLSGLADLEAERTGRAAPLRPADFLKWKSIAFAVRAETAGDPDRLPRPDRLLHRNELLRLERDAAPTDALSPAAGDTSTLVAIDRHGNAVSWVQSLFAEFGSGVVSSSTGIVMHNRLALQTLSEGPWTLRAGERPFHTLCPALVENDDGCEVAIATPGDHGQPQTIHQLLTRLFAEGFDLQAAIEAPRLRHDAGRCVMIEDRAPPEWISEIESCGFAVERIGPWSRLAGGVNAIQRQADGLLLAGADPRRASYAVTAD